LRRRAAPKAPEPFDIDFEVIDGQCPGGRFFEERTCKLNCAYARRCIRRFSPKAAIVPEDLTIAYLLSVDVEVSATDGKLHPSDEMTKVVTSTHSLVTHQRFAKERYLGLPFLTRKLR
jgi:hypothetical protein